MVARLGLEQVERAADAEGTIKGLTVRIKELEATLGSVMWYLQTNWPGTVYGGLPQRSRSWWADNKDRYLAWLDVERMERNQRELAKAAREKLRYDELAALKVEFLQSAEGDRG